MSTQKRKVLCNRIVQSQEWETYISQANQEAARESD